MGEAHYREREKQLNKQSAAASRRLLTSPLSVLLLSQYLSLSFFFQSESESADTELP